MLYTLYTIVHNLVIVFVTCVIGDDEEFLSLVLTWIRIEPLSRKQGCTMYHHPEWFYWQ